MVITSVQIFQTQEDRLKAYATITIDNCFIIRDIKIIQGYDGLFVAMPAKKMKDGSYKDVAHPLNQSTRAIVEETILNAYKEQIAKAAKPSV